MAALTTSLVTKETLADAIPLLMAQFREHEIGTSRAKVLHCVESILSKPGRGFLLLAYSKAAPAGVAYVAFTWTLEHGVLTAWLVELYVVPGMRNRGIGGLLLRAVRERASKMGCAAIDLEVEANHKRAANLYLRARFKPLPRSRFALGLRESGKPL